MKRGFQNITLLVIGFGLVLVIIGVVLLNSFYNQGGPGQRSDGIIKEMRLDKDGGFIYPEEEPTGPWPTEMQLEQYYP